MRTRVFLIETIQWVHAGNLFWSELDSLGCALVRVHRKDLLPILAKVGDKKALLRKIRTKLPQELIGKTLNFEKITDSEYRVQIVEKEEKTEYQKILENVGYTDL